MATFFNTKEGIGCVSVGRPVASDTRGPRFESSHWHIVFPDIGSEKSKIKKQAENDSMRTYDGAIQQKKLYPVNCLGFECREKIQIEAYINRK